jgi:hypothetical protein
MSAEEIKMASKIQLCITFIEAFQKLVIPDKDQIVALLIDNKLKIVNCITNGLQSGRVLNKLKGVKLFRTL